MSENSSYTRPKQAFFQGQHFIVKAGVQFLFVCLKNLYHCEYQKHVNLNPAGPTSVTIGDGTITHRGLCLLDKRKSLARAALQNTKQPADRVIM